MNEAAGDNTERSQIESGDTVPAAMTRLSLVRHGETVWHADNRYAGGTSDIDLTENGVQQALSLAQWARTQHFDAVVVSPVRRVLETARPTADALGLELEIVEDLREVDFGVAEGRTVDELLSLDAEMVRRFRRDPVAHPFPGAESPEVASQRAGAALRDAAQRHLGGNVLVIAHNTLLRLAMCDLLDVPVARYRQLFPRLDNGAVTELVVPSARGEPASLISLNARPPTTHMTGTDHDTKEQP